MSELWERCEYPEILFDDECAVMRVRRLRVGFRIHHQDVGSGPLVIPFCGRRARTVAVPVALSCMETRRNRAPGSDIGERAHMFALLSFGRYFAFCASCVERTRLVTHRFECDPSLKPTAGDAREISPSRRCGPGKPSRRRRSNGIK